MDESLQELENELKALRPRRPSALLRASIERDLARPAPIAPRYASATSLRSWKWLNWPVAAAAAGMLAAIAVALWHRGAQVEPSPALAENTPAPTQPANGGDPSGAAATTAEVYVPVVAASVLYDLRDEGAVTLPGEEEARQARYRYVDTYTWKNPATNASLRLSVPRDEVRVIPARFH